MPSKENRAPRVHRPTKRKIQKTRRAGLAPRSSVLPAAAVLLLGGLGLILGFNSISGRLRSFFGQVLQAGSQATAHRVLVFTEEAASTLLELLAPFLIMVVLAAGLSGFLQVGPLWSREAAKFRLSRIDPMKGLAGIFSLSNLLGLCKHTLVSLLILAASAFILLDALRLLVTLPALAAAPGFSLIGLVILRLMSAIAGLLILAAVADVLWARWKFKRGLRMSRNELLRELRETEGDPRFRARRKKIQQLMAMNRKALHGEALKAYIFEEGRAGALLRYYPASDRPPMIETVAWGAEADRLAEHCRRKGINILADGPLATALARSGSGAIVGEALFGPLAELMASSCMFGAR